MIYKTLKTPLLLATIGAASALTVAAVPIDIRTSNAGGNAGTENILFNEPGLLDNAKTVQGISNQSDFIVNFTSTTSLSTPSGGQSRIEQNFSNMLISLAGGGTFTKAIFNLDANSNGTLGFIVNYVGAVGSPFMENFGVNRNGQNFFQIIAEGGAQISSISLNGTGTTFQDMKQVRIGGFQAPPPPPSVAVPDGGATAAMLGAGMLGVITLRRKLSLNA